MLNSFSVYRRNYGHWDISSKEHGRLFRLRGGPTSQWDVIDEREGKGQNSKMVTFRDQSAAMAYICGELMFELLTVEGQEPHVMESWNIGWTKDFDPFGPIIST